MSEYNERSSQEEPLSEEDLRALQKDRQKKDNHNLSEFSAIQTIVKDWDIRKRTVKKKNNDKLYDSDNALWLS